MKTFDVQSIGIAKPATTVFDFVSDPQNLPRWAKAFKRADSRSAELETPNGAVPIELETITHAAAGSVDWKMSFPDGTVGMAYSRITPNGADQAVYSFVLMAPPVPLEALEGALSAQMKTLSGELATLKRLMEG